ncbi:MAG: undecaprenyl-diphosphate phosphatase [Gammaproteobacteria bacterium]
MEVAEVGLAGGWLHAALLGVVEGITEFLPVSSTGHLIVAAHFLGEHSDAAKLFEVVIQLGAILAVCWHYRLRLWQTAKMTQAAARKGKAPPPLVINLIVAFLPAAVLGLAFYDVIKEYLFSPRSVAIALIIGGIVIIIVERKPNPAKTKAPPKRRIADIDDIRPLDALVIGLAQSLALFPGVSRAGATIIGAMLWGAQRRAATEFSFLLALPVMFAATGYDLLRSYHLLHWQFAGQIACGFAVSFVSALIVIRALLAFVARRNFTPFGYYRIFFGALVLMAL